MGLDFSKYRIHIPVDGSAGSLLEPNESTFPLKESEIFSYKKGIEVVLKEKRGLWLPRSLWDSDEAKKHFRDLGVAGFEDYNYL